MELMLLVVVSEAIASDAASFVGDGIILSFWGDRDFGLFNNQTPRLAIIIPKIVVPPNSATEFWTLSSNHNSRDNPIPPSKIGRCNFAAIFILLKTPFIIDFILTLP